MAVTGMRVLKRTGAAPISPIVALLAFAALLLCAPSASANDLFTLDAAPGPAPAEVAQDSSGSAYIGWLHHTTTGPDQPMFCKVAAGGSCASPISLPIPPPAEATDEVAGVFPVLGPGSTVYVVGPRYVDDDVLLWSSSNGGQSFGPAEKIENGYSNQSNPSRVLLSGESFLISADNTTVGFSVAPIGGPAGNFLKFENPGTGSPVGSGLAVEGAGNPIEAYWTLSEPYAVRFFRYGGTGSRFLESNWAGPTTVANGYETEITGGASGVFLVSQDYAGGQYPSAVDVRKFSGTGFGPPVTLANDASVSLFVGGAAAESPGGRLAVAWPGVRAADGANVMRLFTSTDGGASFTESDVAHIGNAYAINDNAQLTLGDNGQGWVTFRDAGGLRVADLSPIAPAPAPVPPTYKGPTKTVSKKVGGFLLTLRVPKHCLQSQQPFFIGVGKKARRKVKKSVRGKLKILKVTFKFDGKKLSTRKKKPFRQLVSPGPLAPGSRHKVSARVTVVITKHGHKKKTVRVLTGTVGIC